MVACVVYEDSGLGSLAIHPSRFLEDFWILGGIFVQSKLTKPLYDIHVLRLVLGHDQSYRPHRSVP